MAYKVLKEDGGVMGVKDITERLESAGQEVTLKQIGDALGSWYLEAGCEYIKRVSRGKYQMIQSVAVEDVPFKKGGRTGEDAFIVEIGFPNMCRWQDPA